MMHPTALLAATATAAMHSLGSGMPGDAGVGWMAAEGAAGGQAEATAGGVDASALGTLAAAATRAGMGAEYGSTSASASAPLTPPSVPSSDGHAPEGPAAATFAAAAVASAGAAGTGVRRGRVQPSADAPDFHAQEAARFAKPASSFGYRLADGSVRYVGPAAPSSRLSNLLMGPPPPHVSVMWFVPRHPRAPPLLCFTSPPAAAQPGVRRDGSTSVACWDGL